MARKSREQNYGGRVTPAQRKWQFEHEREDYTRWKCNWLRKL